MTQLPGARSGYQRTPLSAEEEVRAEANFAPHVAETLVARGRFRVTADTPEMVELFQKVARRAADMLRRPVVSYANGRDIVITFMSPDVHRILTAEHGWTGDQYERWLTRSLGSPVAKPDSSQA